MTDCLLRNIPCEGFPALELSNADLALTVIPEFGGKIAILYHRPTATGWLWKNPLLPGARRSSGEGCALALDVGGIDECFPAVEPGYDPGDRSPTGKEDLPGNF